MTRMLIVGQGGALDAERIIALMPAKSSPVKRMLDAALSWQVLDMTYGHPRQAVVLLDTGYFAIVPQTVSELLAMIDAKGE